MAELGKDFPEADSKGYDSKTLTKKGKGMHGRKFELDLTPPRIPNGIKRDLSQPQGCWRRLKLQSKKEHDLHRRETRKTDGGKAPASPSEVSKLVADVLPASVIPLEQEFDDDDDDNDDDDAREELDLRRDKDEREVITCEVEPRQLTGKKGAEKVTKKEGNLNRCKRKRT